MSDAETGDEDQKEDGSKAKTLSLKRTVESGQVRQSFSHGRSKSVLVEKRRKRIVRPGQESADVGAVETPAVALDNPETPPQMPDGLSKAEQEKRLAAVAEAKHAPLKKPNSQKSTLGVARRKKRAELKKKPYAKQKMRAALKQKLERPRPNR